jgi:hypothetical protein
MQPALYLPPDMCFMLLLLLVPTAAISWLRNADGLGPFVYILSGASQGQLRCLPTSVCQLACPAQAAACCSGVSPSPAFAACQQLTQPVL